MTDSAPAVVRHLGPAQTIIQCFCLPPRSLPLVPARASEWTALAPTGWRHPNFINEAGDGSGVILVFGFGNPVTRLRFGNPENRYPNIAGGQWRFFNVAVPFGFFDSPLTAKLPAVTLFLPR